MATKTFEELKQLAIQIRDEKTNKQNTATRVGTAMLEHINKLEQDYYDKTQTDEELKERDDKLIELDDKLSTLLPYNFEEGSFYNGAEKIDTNYMRTVGYINLHYNKLTVNKPIRVINYYDENFNFVEFETDTITQEKVQKYSYARFSIRKSDYGDGSDIVIDNGTLTNESITDILNYNQIWLYKYGISGDNGKVTQDDLYSHTDFLPIADGISPISVYPLSAIRLVVFYDKDYNFISSKESNFFDEIPSNAYYLRVSIRRNYEEEVYIYYKNTTNNTYTKILLLQNEVTNINKIVKKQAAPLNLIEYQFEQGSINTADGSTNNDENYVRTSYIDVHNKPIPKVNPLEAFRLISYYDNNLSYISSDEMTDYYNKDKPENAYYSVLVLRKTYEFKNCNCVDNIANKVSVLYTLLENKDIKFEEGGFANGKENTDTNYMRTVGYVSLIYNKLTVNKPIRVINYYDENFNFMEFELDTISEDKVQKYDYAKFSISKTNYGVGSDIVIDNGLDTNASNTSGYINWPYRYIMFGFLPGKGLVIVGSDDFRKWQLVEKKIFYVPNNILFGSTKNVFRDPAFCKIGDWFYFTYTVVGFYKDQNIGNQIGFCRTKDFVNFEELKNLAITDEEIDLSNGWAWAPCFFKIDNKVYVVCGVASNTEMQDFKHYICEYDVDNHSFINCLRTNISFIDCHVYYIDGAYYAIGSTNAIWKSNIFPSATWQKINTSEYINHYEGQIMVRKDNNKFILFGQNVKNENDQVNDAHIYYQMLESPESVFTERKQIEFDSESLAWIRENNGNDITSELYHPTVFDKNNWMDNNNNFFVE